MGRVPHRGDWQRELAVQAFQRSTQDRSEKAAQDGPAGSH